MSCEKVERGGVREEREEMVILPVLCSLLRTMPFGIEKLAGFTLNFSMEI